MNECVTGIKNWMISDKLMLNDDKTEFILIGTRQQLATVDIDNISVGLNHVIEEESAAEILLHTVMF